MIITVDGEKRVASVPATVPQGTNLSQVTIIAPFINSTCVLKIRPPSQEWMEEIICQPALSYEKNCLIWTVNIPDIATAYAGRTDYQLSFIGKNGERFPTFSGSITVSRGIPVSIPNSAEELSDYTINDIYIMLSNVTSLYNITDSHGDRLNINEKDISDLKELTGLESSTLTFARNIIEAVNMLKGTVLGEEGVVTILKNDWSEDNKYVMYAEKTECAYFFNPLSRNDSLETVKANIHLSVDDDRIIFDVKNRPTESIDFIYYISYSDTEISKYINEPNQKVFKINYILNGIDADIENPTTIKEGSTAILKFYPQQNYDLPNSPYISGATVARYEKDSGELVIENPVSDVNLKIDGVKSFLINVKSENVVALGNNPTKISAGSSVKLYFFALEGSTLPTSVSVQGAEFEWEDVTLGCLTLKNPTADVNVEIIGILKSYNITIVSENLVPNETNPTVIYHGQFATFNFTTENGYLISPSTPYVTNATISSWTILDGQMSAVLTISNPTDNVIISVKTLEGGGVG